MTTVRIPADWPATEEQARTVQDGLRAKAVLDEPGPPPGTGRVTGVDVAYDDERDVVAAAAVVLDAASLDVVAEATAVGRISFPYVPGLLAFRELPTVLAALDALPCAPVHVRRSRRPAWRVGAAPGGGGGGRPGPAHPRGREAGLRLGRPPGQPRQRLRPHPRAHPCLPAAGDDPPVRRAVPAGAAGGDLLTAGPLVLSTSSEYLYGCARTGVIGRLFRMTTHRMTHRAPKPLADPNRPVERAVTLGLVLGVLAGLGWIVGMIYTVAGWSL